MKLLPIFCLIGVNLLPFPLVADLDSIEKEEDDQFFKEKSQSKDLNEIYWPSSTIKKSNSKE